MLGTHIVHSTKSKEVGLEQSKKEGYEMGLHTTTRKNYKGIQSFMEAFVGLEKQRNDV